MTSSGFVPASQHKAELVSLGVLQHDEGVVRLIRQLDGSEPDEALDLRLTWATAS